MFALGCQGDTKFRTVFEILISWYLLTLLGLPQEQHSKELAVFSLRPLCRVAFFEAPPRRSAAQKQGSTAAEQHSSRAAEQQKININFCSAAPPLSSRAAQQQSSRTAPKNYKNFWRAAAPLRRSAALLRRSAAKQHSKHSQRVRAPLWNRSSIIMKREFSVWCKESSIMIRMCSLWDWKEFGFWKGRPLMRRKFDHRQGSSIYERDSFRAQTRKFFYENDVPLWEGSWIDVRREFYYDKGVWTRKNKLYYEKESGLWKRKFLWWEENSFMTKMFFYEKEFQKMEKQLLWWNETSIMTNMFYYEKGVFLWEGSSMMKRGFEHRKVSSIMRRGLDDGAGHSMTLWWKQ